MSELSGVAQGDLVGGARCLHRLGEHDRPGLEQQLRGRRLSARRDVGIVWVGPAAPQVLQRSA
ncbi:hypothetical protein BI313_02095 [Xanthomonas vesicatoria]|nr:hypothetical protein BI313_02095 [Xanthomonas vesicatoria]